MRTQLSLDIRNLSLPSWSLALATAHVCACMLSPTLAAIFLVAGVPVWLLAGHWYRRDLKVFNLLVLLQALVSLWNKIRLGMAPVDYLQDLVRYYWIWFWFTTSFSAAGPRGRHLSILACALAAALVGLTAILQVMGLLPMHQQHSALGFLSQPFTTGGIGLLMFFLSYQLYRELPLAGELDEFQRVLRVSLVLQGLLLILLSQRAIWVGLVVGALPMLAFGGLRVRWWHGLLVAAMGGVGFVTFDKMRNKISGLLDPASDQAGIGCRLGLWRVNWEEFKRAPWFGHGEPKDYDCMGDQLTHAHNFYLQTLVTKGILGSLPLFAFLAEHLRRFWMQRAYKLAYICGLVALLAEGMFECFWQDSEVVSALVSFLASSHGPWLPTPNREVASQQQPTDQT